MAVQQDREYLGDGVYIGHDGYQLWLSVEGGNEAPCFIAIEPAVFKSLLAYAKKIRYCEPLPPLDDDIPF